MTDIVQRLRKEADAWDKTGENIDTDLLREAADEIERLRCEAELVAAEADWK